MYQLEIDYKTLSSFVFFTQSLSPGLDLTFCGFNLLRSEQCFRIKKFRSDCSHLSAYMASESQAQSAPKKTQLRWTESMDNILIDVLYEACTLGGKSVAKNVDNGLKAETLQKVVKEILSKLKIVITNENVRSRLKTMKKEYLVTKEAVSQSGFSFNYKTRLVEADPDAWEKYIEGHPDAGKLKGKEMRYYAALEVIVGNEQATGDRAITAEDIPTNPQKEPSGESVVNLDEDEGGHQTAYVTNVSASSQRSCGTQRQKRKRSKLIDDDATGLMETLVSVGNNIASALRGPSWSNIEECIASVPDLTEFEKLDVLDIFIQRPELGPIFEGMSVGMRVAWINKRLMR